jgi:hypothetical protein
MVNDSLSHENPKPRHSADSLFVENEQYQQSNLQSMPIKAIDSSFKKRKNNGEKSQFSIRRDVVHKAIFRAMRRHYALELENSFPNVKISKENFKDLVSEFCSKSFNEFKAWPEHELPND